MNFAKQLVAFAAAIFSFTTAAHSAPVTPVSEEFGNLPGFPGVGSGIPTDPVAYSTFTDPTSGDILVLALSATQRFVGPALNDDGAGTYEAQAGVTVSPVNGSIGATWNFNVLTSIVAGPLATSTSTTLSDFGVELFYDLDPATGTELGDMVSLGAAPAITSFGTSQNLFFNFLSGGAFNPFAAGEYAFSLQSTLGEVAILVDVQAIPLPAAAPLFASALAAGAFLRNRRRRALR